MKLIDNRFRIEGIINERLPNESYIVSDLLDRENKKFLTLYMCERDRDTIDYFTKEYLNISKVNHSSIIKAISFDIVETINLKKNNVPLYYTISEYCDYSLLGENKENFGLEQRLKIILDLMNVISYINFRGFVYRHLSPNNILVSNEGRIKLRDLATVSDHTINSNYDDVTEGFIAPEIFLDAWNACERADYYSIGVMMKYLLYDNYNVECESIIYFSNKLNLNFDEKIFLNNIICNLVNKNPNHRNIDLNKHMDDIIKKFKINVSYDLIKERQQIYFNNNMIGREKELEEILDIDQLMGTGIKKYNGALITGKIGSGRSKFLEEIKYSLKMRGTQAYYIKVERDNHKGNINQLLKFIGNLNSIELLDKYKSGFITQSERFRLYNKVSQRIAELSLKGNIYILIDDINQGDEGFISLINYIMFNLKNNKVFFIISTVNSSLINNQFIATIVREWRNDNSILFLEIKNLNESQVGLIIQSILAMNYMPKRFSSYLYKESQGNLKHLEYIIRDLYNREELYMSKEGNWQTKTRDYSRIYIPLEKNHLIESQLNKIKGNHLIVLKAMSIFKNVIPKPLLMELVNIEEEEVDTILEKFKDDKIIEYETQNLKSSYVFYNTSLKRLVYDGLSNKEKISLHTKVRDIGLKSRLAEKYNLSLEELVYHLVESNSRNIAIELCLEEISRQSNKYSTYTISILELVYGIFENPNDSQILEVIDRLVEIYFIKGDLEETEYYLDRLYNMAKLQKDIRFEIKVDYYKAEIYLIRNELEKVEELVNRIFFIVDNQNLYKEKIIGLIVKSKLALNRNQLEIVKDAIYEAMDMVEEYKAFDCQGNIYNILGIYNHLMGNPSIAIYYFTKSILAFEDMDNIVEAIKPINNIGNIYSGVYSNTIKALRYFEKGYEIANEYGFVQASIVFANNIADIYINDLQYNEALYFCEKAKNNAVEIGDFRGTFLSNLNLGIIYLFTNKYKKSYDIYRELQKDFESTAILEKELKAGYYNFLGQFYGHWGKWPKALLYSYRAGVQFKDYSPMEYLKSEVQILEFKSHHQAYYNKKNVLKSIDKVMANRNANDVLKTIFRFSSISIEAGDTKFTKELLTRFNSISSSPDIPMIKDFKTLIELGLAKTESELMRIEQYHMQSDCEFIYLDYQYHYTLGIKWFNLKEYKKAIGHLLKALDILFRKIQNIDDNDLKYHLIKTRNGDLLKEYIHKAIKREFNKEAPYVYLKDLEGQDYEDYIDINNIFSVLDTNEFHGIDDFKMDNHNIEELEDLLNELTSDYKKNLNLILSFIQHRTLAKKGYILLLDDNDKEYKIISSIENDNSEIPNENLLIQSNRSKMGILLNKGLPNIEKSKYIEFLPQESIGIICLPIMDSKDRDVKERRKNTLSKANKGYIYLETNSYINKFNYENLKLLNTLSNLIYLNIDNDRLKYMSTIDKLTGALTRKYFDYLLDEVFENYNKNQGQFSLLMLDIDNFKNINDNYGHPKGDEILSLIGKTIKQNVRSTDLIGRYGGEEFIIVLFNTTIKDGMKIGDKVRKSIEGLKIPGINRKITVSIGLAQYPVHSNFKSHLISKADQALYNAKEEERKNTILSWSLNMGKSINGRNKAAGIYTGNSIRDNKNISAILDITKSIRDDSHIKEKIYRFLGNILDVVNGEYASMIEIDDTGLYNIRTRKKNKVGWAITSILNESIIQRVVSNKKGEFLIDWEEISIIDEINGTPIWQSILVLPLVKKDKVIKVIYISAPLKEKEFNFEDLNLGELLSSIFIANL